MILPGKVGAPTEHTCDARLCLKVETLGLELPSKVPPVTSSCPAPGELILGGYVLEAETLSVALAIMGSPAPNYSDEVGHTKG